jgi:hypothetical protein
MFNYISHRTGTLLRSLHNTEYTFGCGSGRLSEVRPLQMLLAERDPREENIQRWEAELAAREASLQKKTSEVHAFQEDPELREKKLHRAEQTMQLLLRQRQDTAELLDRLCAVRKSSFYLSFTRIQAPR